MNEILNEIIEKARKTWSGEEGNRRANKVKNVIETRLANYSEVTGYSHLEILKALEKSRNVNTVNFYQENKLPLLDNVQVFDSVNDFKKKYPSGKSICPSCEKISTDFYECSNDDCDWKIYGLFGDMGKGIKVIIKDVYLENPVPINIFKPIEMNN